MGVAFSPDSRYVATAGLEGSAHLWAEQDSAETQAALVQSPVYGDIKSVAFSPDDSRLALGGTDNSIKLVDAASGEVLHTLAGHNGKALAEALVGSATGGYRLSAVCAGRAGQGAEVEQRRRWIQQLEMRKNPFTLGVLAEQRDISYVSADRKFLSR